uniref:AAA family ATPase n=1 Tax=Ruminococcus bicirculans (ex Wegman et al. 2014) TaxID=1160721 RepID=UPI003FD76A89
LASDNKTNIFDFSSATTIMKRKDDEQYLVDDMSIIVGYKKAEKTTIVFTDMIEITNINRLKLLKEYPLSVLSLFETGGYLIIDDLENHFNHEIVSTLIRFFTDKRVNPHGATLIFSTHYSELLEHIKRNDCIYIVENKDKITITPLNERIQRNDENKVQSFKSGLIGNTAPSYEAYIQLKKSIINKVEAIVPSPVRP